jgi:hypothetical protein
MMQSSNEQSKLSPWIAGSQVNLGRLAECLNQLSLWATERKWQPLSRLAHQLKEAGMEQGRVDLAPYAARLERAARDRCTELHIRAALDDLIAACAKGEGTVAG